MTSPNAFESIAGVCKFIATQKIDNKFYEKHFNAIELANSFSRVLAFNYPLIENAFRKSLPMPIEEGGKVIRDAIEKSNLDDDRVKWIDSQLTVVLKALVPVVNDEELPEMLVWCKPAITGAFYEK